MDFSTNEQQDAAEYLQHVLERISRSCHADSSADPVNALRFVTETGVPAIANGMGRGIVPGGHPQLVTKARSKALGQADLVVVVGTPLDFRLGYGVFGGKDHFLLLPVGSKWGTDLPLAPAESGG